MSALSPDLLARAEADVDRAFAVWESAFDAAMAAGDHLGNGRMDAAEKALNDALRRWNDLTLAWAQEAIAERLREARDAA